MSDILLTPLAESRAIRSALDHIAKRMKQGAKVYKRRIGFPGGHNDGTVYWHDGLQFWCLFNPDFLANRYYTCFGTMNPAEHDMVSITVEFNTAHDGVNRALGGLFVRDGAGHVYMAHTGKVGGGRPGIYKGAFWDFYGPDNAETVQWPDRSTSPVAVIGEITSPRLMERTVEFVRLVEEFKECAVHGTLRRTHEERLGQEFRPEFEGKRRGYVPSGEVEARCDHGTVVNRLHDELTEAGRETANGLPDLYILERGSRTHLFEVKTDTSTSSLYQGVGQLMLHGAAQGRTPKCILVLPDQPRESTREALNRLGIAVLLFGWKDGQPVFTRLSDVL